MKEEKKKFSDVSHLYKVGTTEADLKLISTMTWEEAKELFKLPYNSLLVTRKEYPTFVEFDYKFVHENPKLNIEDGYHYSGVAMGYDCSKFKGYPHEYMFLIDNMFDVFSTLS